MTRAKQRKQTICCCNQTAQPLSSQGGENLDSSSSSSTTGHTRVNCQIVRPGKVSPGCSVPSHIEPPPYALDNRLSRMMYNSWLSNKFGGIEVKSEEQIRGMRDACRYDS